MSVLGCLYSQMLTAQAAGGELWLHLFHIAKAVALPLWLCKSLRKLIVRYQISELEEQSEWLSVQNYRRAFSLKGHLFFHFMCHSDKVSCLSPSSCSSCIYFVLSSFKVICINILVFHGYVHKPTKLCDLINRFEMMHFTNMGRSPLMNVSESSSLGIVLF